MERLELTGHVGQSCQAVGVEVLVSHFQHVVLNRPDHHQDEEAAQGELGHSPLSVPGNLLGSGKEQQIIAVLYEDNTKLTSVSSRARSG